MDPDFRNAVYRTLEQNGYHVKKSDIFPYALEVVKPFGVLDCMISWCKSECSQDWRWQLVEMSTDVRPGRYIFYFDSEKEYFAFYMKWS
jgi:hypothetical protein